MKFCTAINCMDGRAQIPVIEFLKAKFGVDYVDLITEPGPNKILAEGSDLQLLDSIKKRLDISLYKHNSVGIAVIGHHDCAGNPVEPGEQEEHTKKAVQAVQDMAGPVPVIGLWIDSDWTITEVQA